MQTDLSDENMKFVGGSMCLDFVNTVDAWANAPERPQARQYGDTPLREKIVDYNALVRWGRLASTISAPEANHLIECAANQPSNAAAMLARALRLRRALYRIFKAVLQHWQPEDTDLDVLHRELAITRKHERLSYRDGVFHWTWDDESESLDRMLWPVARAAADLLTVPDLSRLRQCKGEECGWLFLDTSRNRSRHWCDMSDCGNRDKVRRFRLRK